jgi:cytochrome c oxidase assembly protein Cox11
VHCPNFFQEDKTICIASKRHAHNHFSKVEFDAQIQFNSSHSFGAAKEAVYVHQGKKKAMQV